MQSWKDIYTPSLLIVVSLTSHFIMLFPTKMTKWEPDQYPRAEKTVMLTLTDTVFNRANISFKLTYQS